MKPSLILRRLALLAGVVGIAAAALGSGYPVAQIAATVGTNAVTVLPDRPWRVSAVVRIPTNSTVVVYYAKGAPATVATGIPLYAGELLEINLVDRYTGPVSMITSNGSVEVRGEDVYER